MSIYKINDDDILVLDSKSNSAKNTKAKTEYNYY